MLLEQATGCPNMLKLYKMSYVCLVADLEINSRDLVFCIDCCTTILFASAPGVLMYLLANVMVCYLCCVIGGWKNGW